MKLSNKIISILEKDAIDTTIENIAKKANKPVDVVKKKFMDIEKALKDNPKITKDSLYPIAVSTLKKAFDVD